jgi:hypothetical protein
MFEKKFNLNICIISGFAGAVNQVIDQETQSIFTTKSARERNEQFIQSHSKTLDHRLVGKLPTTFSRVFFRVTFLQFRLVFLLSKKRAKIQTMKISFKNFPLNATNFHHEMNNSF